MFSNSDRKTNYFNGHRYQNTYGWGYKPKYGPVVQDVQDGDGVSVDEGKVKEIEIQEVKA